MRITFVSYDDSPPLGGQGVMLAGMRDALLAHGVSVATISGRGDHAVGYPRVTRRAPLDLSLWLNRHPQVVLRDGADVVHAHGGPGGVLLLRRLRKPLVYTAHHTYSQAHGRTSPKRLLSPLEGRSYRHAARVLAVSRSTADALVRLRIPGRRVEVMPPGVHLPAVEPSLRERGRMLFVGRLEPEKGALTALHVMQRMLAEHADWSGALVGSGSLGDEVERRARTGARIEVLGRVDDARLDREYQRASVVLMPSAYEGLGLVALEAQARGTPVVVFDVTGLRDAVQGGGLVVRERDVDAMVRATRRLLEDADLCAELSAAGREHVAREHAWGVIVRRLLEVYDAVA
ncbi:MAG: glycosyltransferase family 4 protein [Candidatus Dormibacteria bacterium]